MKLETVRTLKQLAKRFRPADVVSAGVVLV